VTTRYQITRIKAPCGFMGFGSETPWVVLRGGLYARVWLKYFIATTVTEQDEVLSYFSTIV